MGNTKIYIIGKQDEETGNIKAALVETGLSVNLLGEGDFNPPPKIKPDLCLLKITSDNIHDFDDARKFLLTLTCPILAIVDNAKDPPLQFLKELRISRIFTRPLRIPEILLNILNTLSEKKNSIPHPDQCSLINLMLETVPNGIYACGVDGEILFCNSSFERITGYSLHELQDMSTWDLTASEEEKGSLEAYFRFLIKEEPSPEPVYVKFLSKKGKTTDVQIDWEYRRDSSDRIAGFICGISDISRLKNNESRWMSLVQYIPELVTILDCNGTILYVNNMLFEMEDSDVLGKSMLDFIDDHQRGEVERCVQQVLETGHPATYQNRFEYNGYTATFINKIGPVYEEGQISGMIIVSIDIEERLKFLEDIQFSEERYKMLFEGTANPITIFDSDGNILMMNKAGAGDFNKKPEEMTGVSIYDLFPGKADELFEYLVEVFESGEDKITENSMPFPDGERWFWSIISCVPGFIKGKRAVQIISYEITDRKKFEQSLKTTLEEKDLLIKEIHHRVKNNIQIISSLLDLQYNKLVDYKDKQLFLESQLRLRAMAIIQEKMYQNRDLSSVDLSEYIRELLHNYENNLSEFQPRISVPIEISEISIGLNEAIPCALLLNELMSNAFKHAWPDGGDGELAIKIFQNDNAIHLTVMDNGTGMNWNEAQHSGSIGIQMVLVLVEQLRGSISVESDNGTCISIVFGGNLFKDKNINVIKEQLEHGGGGKSSILIVEDERITALNFKRLLQRYGYFVPGIVTNSEDALKAIEEYKPDLILMDIVIEGKKDGIEIVRHINDVFPIPVIYTTANNDALVMEEALKTKPAGYITKPVDNIELLNLIHGTLEENPVKKIAGGD